jgi:tRNA(Leu) C34 or U34 (ribose-2'-O)-methylase TrmL
VFGNETEGMPQRILEKHPERCFTIPMSGPVRSLNLSTAVGIVLYEAIRQTKEKHLAADERRSKQIQTTPATDEHG